MHVRSTVRVAVGLAALLSLVAVGCSDSDSATSTASGLGQVKVEMGTTSSGSLAAATTSEPSASLSALEVTVESTRARMTDGTWYEISGTYPMTVNVLALSDSGEVTIGAGLLPEGSYSALEVVISGAAATLGDDTRISVDFPPPGRAVLLAVGFEVVEGQETFLDIHLDMELSFEFADGQFEFEPEFEVEVDEYDD